MQAVAAFGVDSRWGAAIADLTGDLVDLAVLVNDQITELNDMAGEIRRSAGAVPSGVSTEVLGTVQDLVGRYRITLGEIEGWLARPTLGPEAAQGLAAVRRRLTGEVRARQAITAGVMVAADWHSPSIRHSAGSQAGRYDGRVAVHHDDYKRDRHPDESVWEARWLDQMVDNPHGHALRALMTASGMAAFSTILAHVMQRVGDRRPILVGRSTYHECRRLLFEAGGSRVIEMPESDHSAWRDAIALDPAAVFIDSLCNSAGVPVSDVKLLCELLSTTDAYLVVDNTALSLSLQPWAWIQTPLSPRLIVFESLTKYAQLGFDRAAGGVVVSAAEEARMLDEVREHLGSNIADVAVHQHPVPRRALLHRRLGRIGRNAGILADELQRRVDSTGLPVRISYPGAVSHPHFAILADSHFRGGYLSVEPVGQCPVAFSRKLIDAAIRHGVSRSVPLCEGTSFGFDITRLYLTASTSAHGVPFLRIAAGAEDRIGIQEVASVLGDAIEEAV